MRSVYKKPNVSLADFKRTKIIATVGPATNNYASIKALIDAGANGLRLNFSHGTNEERDEHIKWIRKASAAEGKPVAIIQDLQGPKVRLGAFDGIITVQAGQTLSFQYKADYARSGHIPVQFDIGKRVKRGERLLLFDGTIQTQVQSVKDGVVYARADNNGVLIKGKGINLPDSDFAGHIITEKDKKDLAFGSTRDFDYIAISFIQSANDVRAFRKILMNLGSKAKIISKIETAAAVSNIEEIVQESDAIMVARGDLATDVNPEVVPVVQRQIVGLGLTYAKPTIVATQMLGSMTENLSPTRAEVSDVATAVIIGADAVMLSEETAVGKYPIETVEMMKRVILYTQRHTPLKAVFDKPAPTTEQEIISEAIVRLSERLNADAIVAETKTGATARNIASHRPDKPIVTITSEARVAQQLALLYGAQSYLRPVEKLGAVKVAQWLSRNNILTSGDIIVSASGKHPGVTGSTDTIKVRVIE